MADQGPDGGEVGARGLSPMCANPRAAPLPRARPIELCAIVGVVIGSGSLGEED